MVYLPRRSQFDPKENNVIGNVEKERRERCQRRDEECRAICSKQLQEYEETFKKQIFKKEKDCTVLVCDMRNLESVVFHLSGKIKVIYAELEATFTDWKLEKDELSSQIVAEIQGNEEISMSGQRAE